MAGVFSIYCIFDIICNISCRKLYLFSFVVLSTSEVHVFNLFPFHLIIFNTFLERKIYQMSEIQKEIVWIMANTKTRACCGKRFWKLLLLHLPANTVGIIIIICGKHRKIVEQIQVCSYRMLVHRQRHRYDIHMTSTNLIKYKNGVLCAGMRLFLCIPSEVKIMIQNV